jgi:NAD(P)-dependent dehydrogenase (short-subunit alcohol dehydrogenase family)
VTLVVRQQSAASPEEVAVRLREVFQQIRSAVLDGAPAVLCVDAPALLGQASPEDAAVACGMLGLARALAFEGGAKGWVVNVVAVDPGTDPDPRLLDLAGTATGLNGQVLNASASGLGKLVP